MVLVERLTAKTPKRMLALDGGGIRGAMTLGFLERMEQILRSRYQKPDLKLCDYFDLIGGTSTGSIIASGLAIGMNASELKQIYLEIGGKVFGRKKWKKWEALFDSQPLIEKLEDVFKEITLGGSAIKTGLCVVTKRADTGSTWPLINHPNGKYYEFNKDLLLREIVRASTAAPTYFVPEKIDIGPDTSGAFVDGGVSMANNPALQLFLIATLKGYGFQWSTGEDNLLLVSVGTGVWDHCSDVDTVTQGRLWDWAREVPSMLMDDASWQNQLILHYLSRSKTPWTIDSEIGDLSDDLLVPDPILTYLRYDVRMAPSTLETIGLAELTPKLADLKKMEEASNRYDLAIIGEKAAAIQVQDNHFPPAFDLSP